MKVHNHLGYDPLFEMAERFYDGRLHKIVEAETVRQSSRTAKAYRKSHNDKRKRYKRQAGENNFGEQDIGYTALAYAIVKQAIDDWYEAERVERGEIRFSSTRENPFTTKRDIVTFFKSQWYGTLCDIDSQRILRKLGEI